MGGSLQEACERRQHLETEQKLMMATAVKAAGSLLQQRRCEVDWLYVKMLHQNVEKWMTHRFVLSMKQSLQKWVADRFWNTKNRPHLKRLRKFDACKCTATASAASCCFACGVIPRASSQCFALAEPTWRRPKKKNTSLTQRWLF